MLDQIGDHDVLVGYVAHAAHLGIHIGQARQFDRKKPTTDAIAEFKQR
jgi:hypothetical protein